MFVILNGPANSGKSLAAASFTSPSDISRVFTAAIIPCSHDDMVEAVNDTKVAIEALEDGADSPEDLLIKESDDGPVQSVRTSQVDQYKIYYVYSEQHYDRCFPLGSCFQAELSSGRTIQFGVIKTSLGESRIFFEDSLISALANNELSGLRGGALRIGEGYSKLPLGVRQNQTGEIGDYLMTQLQVGPLGVGIMLFLLSNSSDGALPLGLSQISRVVFERFCKLFRLSAEDRTKEDIVVTLRNVVLLACVVGARNGALIDPKYAIMHYQWDPFNVQLWERIVLNSGYTANAEGEMTYHKAFGVLDSESVDLAKELEKLSNALPEEMIEIIIPKFVKQLGDVVPVDTDAADKEADNEQELVLALDEIEQRLSLQPAVKQKYLRRIMTKRFAHELIERATEGALKAIRDYRAGFRVETFFHGADVTLLAYAFDGMLFDSLNELMFADTSGASVTSGISAKILRNMQSAHPLKSIGLFAPPTARIVSDLRISQLSAGDGFSIVYDNGVSTGCVGLNPAALRSTAYLVGYTHRLFFRRNVLCPAIVSVKKDVYNVNAFQSLLPDTEVNTHEALRLGFSFLNGWLTPFYQTPNAVVKLPSINVGHPFIATDGVSLWTKDDINDDSEIFLLCYDLVSKLNSITNGLRSQLDADHILLADTNPNQLFVTLCEVYKALVENNEEEE